MSGGGERQTISAKELHALLDNLRRHLTSQSFSIKNVIRQNETTIIPIIRHLVSAGNSWQQQFDQAMRRVSVVGPDRVIELLKNRREMK